MIDFLVPTPFTMGFLLVPFFGLFLIKLTKYKKTGVTLIVIFLGFLLYLLVKGNFVSGVNANFLDQGYLSILNIRTVIVFVFLMVINISAYYNYGFKYFSLILFVYMLNSAIDITILFSDFSQIAERPYFSVFQLSRPLFVICLLWIVIVHKDKIKDA